jgi:hypothetical protein
VVAPHIARLFSRRAEVRAAALPVLLIELTRLGVDPAVLHAIRRTGIVVAEGADEFWREADLHAWDSAIEDWQRQSGGRV